MRSPRRRARLADAARRALRRLPGNYAAIDAIPAIADLRFNGILLDLGISSHQIDDASRGFSFREGAPLDMRMGGAGDAAPSAEELLDERERGGARAASSASTATSRARAGSRARSCAAARRARSARATISSGAIRGALGARTGPPDFARLFQAVRIAVNDELAGLARALPALRDRLAPAARWRSSRTTRARTGW